MADQPLRVRGAASVAHARGSQRTLRNLSILAVPLLVAFGNAAASSDPFGRPGASAWLLSSSLLLVTLAWTVVLQLWSFHAYSAVTATGAGRYLRMWAVIGWLIPIANLFVPKQIVNDIWRAGGGGRLPVSVQAWWVCWVVVVLLLSRWPWHDLRPDLPPALVLLPLVVFVLFVVLTVRATDALTERLRHLR